MLGEFTVCLLSSFLSTLRKFVDGAQVIQTTTRNIVPGRRVCTGHDPGRTKRNGVHFVGREGIPDNELAILRGADEVTGISGPVQSIYFAQMALENASLLQCRSDFRNALLLACNNQWLLAIGVTPALFDFLLQGLDFILGGLHVSFAHYSELDDDKQKKDLGESAA